MSFNRKLLKQMTEESRRDNSLPKYKVEGWLDNYVKKPVVNKNGYLDGEPPAGSNWRIPGNKITMDLPGMPNEILAVSDKGERKRVKKGEEATFNNAKYVDEYSLPKAQLGKVIPSWLNPYNWGVEDYSKEKDFNKAFEKAKRSGKKEFMWNSERYSTKSNMSPEQQIKAYGITDKQRTNNASLFRKNIANLNTSIGYDLPFSRILKTAIFNNQKQNEYYSSSEPGAIEEDALQLYLGLPQKHGNFTTSKYKPGAFDIIGYADKLPDTMPSDEEILKYGSPKYYEDQIVSIKPYNDFVMGRHTVKKGKDKKGEYIEYIDKWDLDTYKKFGIPIGEIADYFNKPFEIYGRKYYDPKTKKAIKKHGGDISIPNLEEGNWLNRYDDGGSLPKFQIRGLDNTYLPKPRVNFNYTQGKTYNQIHAEDLQRGLKESKAARNKYKIVENKGQTKSKDTRSWGSESRGKERIEKGAKFLTKASAIGQYFPPTAVPSIILNSASALVDARDAYIKGDATGGHLNMISAIPLPGLKAFNSIKRSPGLNSRQKRNVMAWGVGALGADLFGTASDLTDEFGTEEKKYGGWLDRYDDGGLTTAETTLPPIYIDRNDAKAMEKYNMWKDSSYAYETYTVPILKSKDPYFRKILTANLDFSDDYQLGNAKKNTKAYKKLLSHLKSNKNDLGTRKLNPNILPKNYVAMDGAMAADFKKPVQPYIIKTPNSRLVTKLTRETNFVRKPFEQERPQIKVVGQDRVQSITPSFNINTPARVSTIDRPKGDYAVDYFNEDLQPQTNYFPTPEIADMFMKERMKNKMYGPSMTRRGVYEGGGEINWLNKYQ